VNVISCEKKHDEVLTYRSEVKVSLERAGQVVRTPGGKGSQDVRQAAHEGGKVVIPMH